MVRLAAVLFILTLMSLACIGGYFMRQTDQRVDTMTYERELGRAR